MIDYPERKNAKDMTREDLNNEMRVCTDVGEKLFNFILKETDGYGPRVILSTAILLLALSEKGDDVLPSILNAVKFLDEQVSSIKEEILAEAKASTLN